MVFIAHFFCTRPPYSTARAGMDMSPTSVAAVICQALSPEPSQVGYGITVLLLRRPAFTQRSMFPMQGFRGHFPFVTPPVTCLVRIATMFPECVGKPAAWDNVRISG